MFTSAYPPTDILVRDHLLAAPSASLEKPCKEYIRSFLGALFRMGCRLVECLFPAGKNTSYAGSAVQGPASGRGPAKAGPQ